MSILDEKLWSILTMKVQNEDEGLRHDQQIGYEYLVGVRKICRFGVDRAITIRDSFPMYTLHDETHICNVMRLMIALLGDYANKLTRDEAAMLILAACCHDIGMSYSDVDKSELLADFDRLNQYLDAHHGEYVKAYIKGGDKPDMTDDMIQDYLRNIHHERIMDLLCNLEWPTILEGRINRQDLILVCQSHGKDTSSLDELDQTPTIDLRFCAALLRLADILDFDTSRAPQAVYDYSGIGSKESAGVIKSREEWNKHMVSHGFDFEHTPDRSYPYLLNYSATSKSMQIEQTIYCYLDWVDQELNHCGKQMKRFTGKWNSLILPGKIKRNIKSEGYVSGQFRLTLDQSQIMELLVGKDLYSDPSVFVRELIQNAIDAVRTRKQLDKDLPRDWKAQINIRSWLDDEGNHWFRIEDNGIGMTEDTIMNFFLKIGRSYYTSDTFQQAKLRCKADPNYMPISRFGIGILSCFMGDEPTNQVEVSTKHFNEGGDYYPALRLSMHGLNGYYYMASKEKNHFPGPMKGVSPKEKEHYLKQAGTIIAVRTNLYQTGKYRGFKEIVDRYVVYPPVAIHYDGIEGSFDYPTELEFMSNIHGIQPSDNLSGSGLIEFSLTDEQLQQVYNERPEIAFTARPKILLKCISLDYYTDSPYLSGAILLAQAEGKHSPITVQFGARNEIANVDVELSMNKTRNELGLRISLKFLDSFSKKMSLIEENNQTDHQIYDELRSFYRNDKYRSEILYALSSDDIDSTSWQEYMMHLYNVSLTELQKTIDELEASINNIAESSPDDIATLRAYQSIQKEWKFTLCNLMQFEWYKDYFQKINNNTGMFHISAHNGILCGNANFYNVNNRNSLATIMLFKDKYRPNVDIARDGIRQFTLETACDLEVIRNSINKQGFELSFGNNMEKAGYSNLPMEKYWALLEERADIKGKLRVQTNEGEYTLDELSAKIKEHGKLMKNTPRFFYHNDSMLYEYLCMAYLRKKFSVRMELDKFDGRVYIMTKEPENLYEDILPCYLFLAPLKSECRFLTNKERFFRYAYTTNHRFSIWLQTNCVRLNRYVPGIFNEMLRILNEDGEQLVLNINALLSRLRNMPGEPFNIQDELFLTEEDLC